MVMKRTFYRIGFTAQQSAELWERWKKGEGLKAIGRVFGKPSSCIFTHLAVSGGIRPPARPCGPLGMGGLWHRVRNCGGAGGAAKADQVSYDSNRLL
jgi:hypothetical protein